MSSFGRVFRVSTFGESHCKGVGCIIEGCPPGLQLTEDDIQPQLTRRRPGQSRLTTPRDEKDLVTIMSGTELGKTLGTPIGLFVPNNNVRPGDYKEMSKVPRPGHADYTYQLKYGVRASSGGGRASARETIGRVAAGAVAEKWLSQQYGTTIVGFVCSIGDISIPESAKKHPSGRPWTREEVDTVGRLQVLRNPADGQWKRVSEADEPDKSKRGALQVALDNANEDIFVKKTEEKEDSDFAYKDYEGNVYTRTGRKVTPTPSGEQLAPWLSDELIPVRCPHPETACKMSTLIRSVKSESDSIGGSVACVCSNVPVGLGEPCFDKLEAMLAHAMLSLPATKGFEFGSGFEGTKLRGSQHNDAFTSDASHGAPYLSTKTNNAGGILGGISSGQDISFRVAVKPVSTIGRAQPTADFEGKDTVLEAKGRHDPCVLPRTPPLLECMSALVLADAAMLQRTRHGGSETAIVNQGGWVADPSLKSGGEEPPSKKAKTEA